VQRRLFLTCILAGPVVLAQDSDSESWTVSAKEHFLLTARIIDDEAAGKGLTNSRKVTMSDGRRTHKAHVQTLDVYTPLFKGKDGSQEKDFKDSWKFNVAAYRLAKMLHLTDMVPVSVARVVNGKPASLDWWVDGVLMDEKERLQQHISPPDVSAWNRQMDTIRVFDQLIYNMDRSQENLLIARDWKPWMIDHSRSFRKWTTLRDPAAITHCNPDLLRALQKLRRDELSRELSLFLTAEEIDGLLARRDLIVNKIQSQRGTSTRSGL
jgi:hypothetical protein